MTKQTKLYEKHVGLTGGKNMADFAGYEMPLWYSSIKAEHNAVRETAGLFDCTHMGVLEFSGPTAGKFLNLVTGNNIEKLADGKAQYSFFFDENGIVLDDLIVYRVSADKYLMVVNAANDDKVQAHLAGIAEKIGDRLADLPVIRDLRDPSSGEDRRLVMPLQGPKSKELLLSIIESPADKEKFDSLGSFCFCDINIGGIQTLVCRTGYTGAAVGCEFLIHPDKVGDLWDIILDAGKEEGVLPCGLGARDSLRIEAGLPLYGHELEGEFGISPFQAGYNWAVDLEKDWFLGIEAVKAKAENFDMRIFRLEFDGSKGVRPVREYDGVLDIDGVCVGCILSSVKVDEKQVALAYCKVGSLRVDEPIGGYYVARNPRHIKQGKVERCEVGGKYESEIKGGVLKRFERF